jgi:hypothetical protein
MAALVGLIAAAIALLAVAFAGGGLLYAVGVNQPPKWAILFVTGVSLSAAVTAFQEARKFALTRPRLRYEVGKTALFIVGAGVLFGLSQLYSYWRSQAEMPDLLQKASTEIAQRLPMRLDENTTLIATRVYGMDWFYTYRVSRGPFDLVAQERDVRKNFCASKMKEWVSKGVLFNFEYLNEQSQRVAIFNITSCP